MRQEEIDAAKYPTEAPMSERLREKIKYEHAAIAACRKAGMSYPEADVKALAEAAQDLYDEAYYQHHEKFPTPHRLKESIDRLGIVLARLRREP